MTIVLVLVFSYLCACAYRDARAIIRREAER